MKDKILTTAFDMVAVIGLDNIRRDGVARQAGVALALVNYYYKDMAGLRDAVMKKAVSEKHLGIICQGLVRKDPIAQAAAEDLRRAALATLV